MAEEGRVAVHKVAPEHAAAQVQARVQGGQAVLLVINTVGADAGALPGHGMALHNVRERLRLLHDVAAQLDVWREPGRDGGGDRFHARIVVPLDR